MKTKLCRLV